MARAWNRGRTGPRLIGAMDVHITIADIALRLALTLAACAVIGFNRSQRGRTAGLRTTMLVGLAAAAAMIECNLLLATDQEGPAAYIRMDVMRLPLGILSGIGFIGAGAIVKRNDLVQGVTTAATLWLVTVVGLVFGAGQLGLGGAITAITFLVLWLLKLVEDRLRQEQHGVLTLSIKGPKPSDAEVRSLITEGGHRITAWSPLIDASAGRRQLFVDVAWRERGVDPFPPAFVGEIAAAEGVERTEWKPHSDQATPH
jgi:putative Mg2+ transporter-C (MgtC) family protein